MTSVDVFHAAAPLGEESNLSLVLAIEVVRAWQDGIRDVPEVLKGLRLVPIDALHGSLSFRIPVLVPFADERVELSFSRDLLHAHIPKGDAPIVDFRQVIERSATSEGTHGLIQKSCGQNHKGAD